MNLIFPSLLSSETSQRIPRSRLAPDMTFPRALNLPIMVIGRLIYSLMSNTPFIL